MVAYNYLQILKEIRYRSGFILFSSKWHCSKAQCAFLQTGGWLRECEYNIYFVTLDYTSKNIYGQRYEKKTLKSPTGHLMWDGGSICLKLY